MEAGVKKAQRGKSPGPSGWRFEHVKAAFSSSEGREAVRTILNAIAHGSFGVTAEDDYSLVTGARFLAMKRDPNATKIRPIAVGECLRRLAGSCLVRKLRPAINHACLKGKNLAFAKDGSCIGHKAVSLLLQEHPDWLLVETDLADAFQHASREDMLHALHANSTLRKFLPLFLNLYDCDARLFYEDVAVLRSEEGCQQGCPLGTVLFCLSVAEHIERVAAVFPDVEIIGLADDYRFLGPKQQALDAAQMYLQLVQTAGHVSQVEKAKVFSLSAKALADAATEAHPLFQQMKVVPASDGLVVLGAPIGSDDWCRDWLWHKVQDIQVHLDAVTELGRHAHPNAAQCAWLILRWSASTRFGHLLRSVPPMVIKPAAEAVDDAVSACFASLLDPHLSLPADVHQRCLEQAVLPVCEGGMGLQCCEMTRHHAYVAAWGDCARFIRLDSNSFPHLTPLMQDIETSRAPALRAVVAAWRVLERGLTIPCPEDPTLDPIRNGLVCLKMKLGEQVRGLSTLGWTSPQAQKRLATALLEAHIHQAWTLSKCDRDRRRRIACSGKEAAWVVAIPSRPKYCLLNSEWRDAIAFRLGVPLPSLRSGPVDCDCHHASHERTAFLARNSGVKRYRNGAPRTSTRRGNRRRLPAPVDANGEHDQRCPSAYKLGRHNTVQYWLRKLLHTAGLVVEQASVRELRRDSTDPSRKQADLLVRGLHGATQETLLDIGITHSTIDTYLNNQSMWKHGDAANHYARRKERQYSRLIAANNLDYDYYSFGLESYGAFGTSTWKLINEACDPHTHPLADGDYSAWGNPDPKRDFILTIGFALQRGNARMIQKAAQRRATNADKYNCRLSSSSDEE